MSILKNPRVALRAGSLVLLATWAVAAIAFEPTTRVTPLLSTGQTVMDEPIVYPTGAPAKVTTAIISMSPGAETGWHKHGVPLVGFVLEGELTVDYGPKGKRTYKQGESVVEAIDVPHNGRNTGTGTMRLFVVYMGADGLKTTIPTKH